MRVVSRDTPSIQPTHLTMSSSFIADLDTLSVLANPTILDPTLGDEIREHLVEHGYALVKAMEPDEARAIYSEFWDWLEALGTGIKRDAPSTWDSETSWPDQVHGIVKSYGIGQAAFMWKCRTAPGVLKAFREVWLVESEEDLITSFDGAGMYPGRVPSDENEDDTKGDSNNQAKGHGKQAVSPRSVKRPRTSPSPFTRDGEYKLWPHRDQAADKGSMLCVQGVVNLTSNEGKYDGGLVVWPGSHLIDWTVKYPGMSGTSGFFKIPDGKLGVNLPISHVIKDKNHNAILTQTLRHGRNHPFPLRDFARSGWYLDALGLAHNPLQPPADYSGRHACSGIYMYVPTKEGYTSNPPQTL